MIKQLRKWFGREKVEPTPPNEVTLWEVAQTMRANGETELDLNQIVGRYGHDDKTKIVHHGSAVTRLRRFVLTPDTLRVFILPSPALIKWDGTKLVAAEAVIDFPL